jgi:hypothetical protein
VDTLHTLWSKNKHFDLSSVRITVLNRVLQFLFASEVSTTELIYDAEYTPQLFSSLGNTFEINRENTRMELRKQNLLS